MFPAPSCGYYWPPPLESCIAHLESEIRESERLRVPVGRVLVLGAGFSSAFQFATAKTILGGVMEFAEGWQRTEWYGHRFQQVARWLDEKCPDWRAEPPSLYEFIDQFFDPLAPHLLHDFTDSSDPLKLFCREVSWESENTDSWIDYDLHRPRPQDGRVLRAFEALMATYLFAGRFTREVQMPWALDLFRALRPNDVIITFNWDVIPEALMVTVGTPFCRYDWCSDRVKLVKLHGSVDLLGVPNVAMRGDLAQNPERFECVTDLLWRVRTTESVLPRSATWPFGRSILPWERYNKHPVLIMPPRYSLGYGYRLIQFIWRKARAALERSQEVHIIGYSLSEEDRAFRSLLSQVADGWNAAVTVDIWNPDPRVGEIGSALIGPRVSFHQTLASSFRFR